MPEPLDKHSVDLLSAALRHVRDAEHLATPNHSGYSPDQAYHLAGFGPECARKATLYYRLFDKPLGHTLGAGATTALGIALSLDPVAQRYQPRSFASIYRELAAWVPDCRYERTGSRKQPQAIVREARDVVDGITAALWADGRLPDTFLARGGW
jgi:hypothetical protein